MTEIKFTSEELETITGLQKAYQTLGEQLLQARLAALNAEDYLDKVRQQETALNQTIMETNAKEAELAKELEAKYGKGELNMETGVFTSTT